MTRNFELGDPASPGLLELLRHSELDIVMRAGHFEVIACPKQEQPSHGHSSACGGNSRNFLRNTPAEGPPTGQDDRGIHLVQLDAVGNGTAQPQHARCPIAAGNAQRRQLPASYG